MRRPEGLAIFTLTLAHHRRRPLIVIAGAALLASWPAASSADGLKIGSEEIVSEGIADMRSSLNKTAARNTAIKQAQRAAIEQALGVLVKSAFSAEQRESLKEKKHTFESKVDDRIYSKSQGFIERYEILEEKREGDIYRIKIKAQVRTASLKTELEKLGAILAQANYPKVMLIVGERYTDAKGKQSWIAKPTSVATIEQILLRFGFEMVAQDQAEQLRRESLDTFGDLLGDDKRIAEVASKYGAEVAVVGSAEVKSTGFNKLGRNMHYLAAVLNLRAINNSTAKILASFEQVGKGAGASDELARVKAVKAAAKKGTTTLVDALARAWQREADQGRRYRVVLLKVPHYRKVARPFIKAMRGIENVTAAKELNFGGQRLELEIIFKGSKEDLLDGIFEATDGNKKFENIDKVLDRGDSVELTL